MSDGLTRSVTTTIEATDDGAALWYAQSMLLPLSKGTWDKLYLKIEDQNGRILIDEKKMDG